MSKAATTPRNATYSVVRPIRLETFPKLRSFDFVIRWASRRTYCSAKPDTLHADGMPSGLELDEVLDVVDTLRRV
jgi:hypothetical protein